MSRLDVATGHETAWLGAGMEVRDSGLWTCHTHLEKFWGDQTDTPYEVMDIDGNILVTGGVSALLHRLLGGTAVAAFDATNCAIGVGDNGGSTTNNVDTAQTDLQATTNKLRKGMDASYPQHTDTNATASSKFFTVRSTWGTSEGNFVWNEWGVFNSATAGAGRMLNRKVQALGTKVAGSTWQLTVQVAIA